MPSTLAFDPITFAFLCTCLLLLGALCAYIGGKVWDGGDKVSQADLDARWTKMTEHYAECFERQMRINRDVEVELKAVTGIDANARLIQSDAERANLQAQMDAVVARVNALETRPAPKLSAKRKH